MSSKKKSSSPSKEGDILAPKQRAEDIILGALGFGEDASIVSIAIDGDGFRGIGRWSDGEEFSFENEDTPSELEKWAIAQLVSTNKS